jgi:hypothetical protein
VDDEAIGQQAGMIPNLDSIAEFRILTSGDIRCLVWPEVLNADHQSVYANRYNREHKCSCIISLSGLFHTRRSIRQSRCSVGNDVSRRVFHRSQDLARGVRRKRSDAECYKRHRASCEPVLKNHDSPSPLELN